MANWLQRRSERSDRSLGIFTWLLTRRKTYIKGARLGGHENILPLQVMLSVTTTVRGKNNHRQHVSK